MRNLGLQQEGDRLHLGDGDQDLRAGVGQDFAMPAQMLFDLAGPGRGIEGDRHQSRIEHPEKAEEIIDIGRQHDGDGIPRFQRQGLQQGGYLPGPLPQLPVADQPFRLALQQEDVAGIGVGSGMLLQHLDEGDGRMDLRRGLPRCTEIRRAPPRPGRLFRRCRGQMAQDIARGLRRRQHLFRQAHGKRLLQTGQQFHAGQTVQAEVAIKPAVEGDFQTGCGLGMQFRQQLREYFQERFRGRGRLHASPGGRSSRKSTGPAGRD